MFPYHVTISLYKIVGQVKGKTQLKGRDVWYLTPSLTTTLTPTIPLS